MKTLGLLGGMSWESTVPYYQAINRRVAERLGGLHSARLVMFSVDFAEIEAAQHADRWEDAEAILVDGVRRLEAAGAEAVVLCTNTMHLLAPALEAATALPLLHIVDPTGRAVIEAGVKRVGLLGTRFTMEQAFYRDRLASDFGLDVLTPEIDDRARIHALIYDDLCHGRVPEAGRAWARELVARLAADGAEGVILGCTELGLLLQPGDVEVPLFDTALLHAVAAADHALGEAPPAV